MTGAGAAAKRAAKRARRRTASKANRATRKQQHKQAVADQQERQGEAMAPAAQRHGVTAQARTAGPPLEEVEIALDARGRPYGRGKLVAPTAQVTLRGPRIERDGLTFVVSNPIRHLVQRGKGAERPMFRKIHEHAAETLRQAWEEAGEGVSVGVAQYDRVRGSNIPQTGYISDAVLTILDRQIAQQDLIRRARAALGEALWRPIVMVVLRGIDVSTWAAQDGLNRQVAIGYLAAAVDRLAECLNRQKGSRIRSVQVELPADRTPDVAAENNSDPNISDHADIISA